MPVWLRVKRAMAALDDSLVGDAIGAVCLFVLLYAILVIGGLLA